MHACAFTTDQLNRQFESVCVLQVMVVVGGQAPKAIRSVECYDFEEERWFQVAELPSRRCRAGVPTVTTVKHFCLVVPLESIDCTSTS